MTPQARQAWRTETQEELDRHGMDCADGSCQACQQNYRLIACLDALDICERERDRLRETLQGVYDDLKWWKEDPHDREAPDERKIKKCLEENKTTQQERP